MSIWSEMVKWALNGFMWACSLYASCKQKKCAKNSRGKCLNNTDVKQWKSLSPYKGQDIKVGHQNIANIWSQMHMFSHFMIWLNAGTSVWSYLRQDYKSDLLQLARDTVHFLFHGVSYSLEWKRNSPWTSINDRFLFSLDFS